jgi:hypothetical protein
VTKSSTADLSAALKGAKKLDPRIIETSVIMKAAFNKKGINLVSITPTQ